MELQLVIPEHQNTRDDEDNIEVSHQFQPVTGQSPDKSDSEDLLAKSDTSRDSSPPFQSLLSFDKGKAKLDVHDPDFEDNVKVDIRLDKVETDSTAVKYSSPVTFHLYIHNAIPTLPLPLLTRWTRPPCTRTSFI